MGEAIGGSGAAGAWGSPALPVGICEGELSGAQQDGQNLQDDDSSSAHDGHRINALRPEIPIADVMGIRTRTIVRATQNKVN